MSKKIDKSKIKIQTGKSTPAVAGKAKKAEVVAKDNPLRIRFYDVKTGNPLPLSAIEERLDKNFQRLDRLSNEVLIDLWFVHHHWDGFYNRSDSWEKWMREHIPLSRSYTFDIIKIINLITGHIGLSMSEQPDTVAELFDKIGLGRLKLVAQIENPDRQKNILDELISGKEYTPDEILAVNRKNQPPKTRIIDTGHSVESRVIDDQDGAQDVSTFEGKLEDEKVSSPKQEPSSDTVMELDEKDGFTNFYLRDESMPKPGIARLIFSFNAFEFTDLWREVTLLVENYFRNKRSERK